MVVSFMAKRGSLGLLFHSWLKRGSMGWSFYVCLKRVSFGWLLGWLKRGSFGWLFHACYIDSMNKNKVFGILLKLFPALKF